MRILYHPPHPPVTNIILTVLFLISLKSTNAQKWEKDTFLLQIEPFFVYESSIKEYWIQKWKSERIGLKEANEKQIFQYLPQFGITFGLPSISWNPANILQAKRDKKLLEMQLQSHDKKYELIIKEELQKAKNEYIKFQIFDKALNRLKREVDHKTLFFNDFTSKEHFDKIITPKEFRQKTIELELSTNEYEAKKEEYLLLLLEFQKMVKYNLPDFNLPKQEKITK
jgi:hypothetical protein